MRRFAFALLSTSLLATAAMAADADMHMNHAMPMDHSGMPMGAHDMKTMRTLEGMDLNRDGIITSEECAQVHLGPFDTNKDGKLDAAEIKAAHE